jgi:hypothetical protein
VQASKHIRSSPLSVFLPEAAATSHSNEYFVCSCGHFGTMPPQIRSPSLRQTSRLDISLSITHHPPATVVPSLQTHQLGTLVSAFGFCEFPYKEKTSVNDQFLGSASGRSYCLLAHSSMRICGHIPKLLSPMMVLRFMRKKHLPPRPACLPTCVHRSTLRLKTTADQMKRTRESKLATDPLFCIDR